MVRFWSILGLVVAASAWAGLPPDDDWVPGGPIPTLQETLFATGARESRHVAVSGAPATETMNNAAGTHDGLVATADKFHIDNTGDINPTEDIIEVIYDFDDATHAGSISYVRVVQVAHKTITSVSDFADIEVLTAGAGFASPAYELPPTGRTLSGAPTSIVYILPNDLLDQTPWTTAKINARKWGHGTRLVTPGLNELETSCSEIYLEVWGFD